MISRVLGSACLIAAYFSVTATYAQTIVLAQNDQGRTKIFRATTEQETNTDESFNKKGQSAEQQTASRKIKEEETAASGNERLNDQ